MRPWTQSWTFNSLNTFNTFLYSSIFLSCHHSPHAKESFLPKLISRAERSQFAQGHVKMVSFFPVLDIPLRFISFNGFFSAPIGRIYPILNKHYDGFTIYHFKFSAAKNFFRRVISDKNFNFRIFKRAKDIFFSPVFGGSLKMLMLLH